MQPSYAAITVLTNVLHHVYSQILFDMDGCGAKIAMFNCAPQICPDIFQIPPSSTLIDSTPGVLVAWDSFGKEYGFDGATAAHEGHGRRLADSLAERCDLKSPEQLAVRPVLLAHFSDSWFLYRKKIKLISKAAIVRFEQAVIEGGPVALPGAQAILSQLEGGSSPFARGWTIVTSGTYRNPLSLAFNTG